MLCKLVACRDWRMAHLLRAPMQQLFVVRAFVSSAASPSVLLLAVSFSGVAVASNTVTLR